MKRKVTNEVQKQIIKLKKKGLPITQISKLFNISDRTVLKYSKGIRHPNRKDLIRLSKQSKKFTPEKAEIIGFLCAEGNDNIYNDNSYSFDKRRGKSYLRMDKREWINFSNSDNDIQTRFLFLLDKVYNYPCKVYKKGSVYIKRKEVVKDLWNYTHFGSKKWKIPRILFKKEYKKHATLFLKGFIDGDGTIDVKRKRLIIDSTNSPSLNEMSILIKKLGIKKQILRFWL